MWISGWWEGEQDWVIGISGSRETMIGWDEGKYGGSVLHSMGIKVGIKNGNREGKQSVSI